jgi:AbrB family looped-hinge helix DNA binding protein
MPRSKITSKGQITIPKPIRKVLRVEPGDPVELFVDAAGRVVVRAATVHVSELRGLLRKPGQKPVTIEAMNEAIRRRHRKAT